MDADIAQLAQRKNGKQYATSQKDRRLVLKVSGFSELAWGSRGVTIGHDVSSEEWRRLVAEA